MNKALGPDVKRLLRLWGKIYPKVPQLSQPGQPDHIIALPARTLDECLAEELRRLDDDPVYGEALATFGTAS